LAAHGVADPLRVLGEDVDEVLLGAVVEALRVAIERAHDVALVLEPAHPCFDRSVGHPRPSHQRGRRERNLSTRRPRVEQRERWRGIGPMRSARVGRSGLTVSKLCLGTWYFGGPTPYDEALALMRAALDGGITFWDTSDHYNAGGSESVIGRGLRELGVRDEIVLATKVFYPMGPGPNDRGGGRRYLLRELDAQLKRLQTDWIDVYMLHRSDFDTPLDETIETLDACVKAGKIRYWGTSTFPAWRVAEAWWRSELRGWTHPICEEAPYNLLDRRVEADRVRFLREYGLGFFTWSSIAGGLLTGKYAVNANENPPPGTRLKDMHER